MSLSRLASQHVVRSGRAAALAADHAVPPPEDIPAGPPVPKGADLAPPPVNARADAKKAAASDDRFDRLTKYIPTETITLFVAAMSVLPNLQHLQPKLNAGILLVLFAVATPLLLIVIDLGKHRLDPSAGRYRPEPWPLVAALIAFIVWAHSVPGVVPVGQPDARIAWAFGASWTNSSLPTRGRSI